MGEQHICVTRFFKYMARQSADDLENQITATGLTVGNTVRQGSANLPVTPSLPLFADSNSNLNAAGFPFSVPFLAGVTSTSNSFASIEGSSTGTANDLMHQTLVLGANVTTFTSQGFARVTITDDAGNITNGQYYVQFGTLS